MNSSTSQILNRKKFIIQILIAIGISVFFQLVIDPLIYDPFIRENLGGLIEAGDAIVICSLSMWFLSFSMAFLYYRNNEIINNYLFCAFLPLLLIVGFEFASLFFIDFLHIPPVIIGFVILWRYRATLKLRNVLVTSLVLVIWIIIVRLVGTNYQSVSLFPMGLLAIIFWPLLNIFLYYLVIHFRKTT